MRHDEPEITQIAKFLATRVRNPQVSFEATVEAWRSGLRYARKSGLIREVVADLKAEAPDDPSLHAVLDEALR